MAENLHRGVVLVQRTKGYQNEKDGCGEAPHKGNVFSVYKRVAREKMKEHNQSRTT